MQAAVMPTSRASKSPSSSRHEVPASHARYLSSLLTCPATTSFAASARQDHTTVCSLTPRSVPHDLQAVLKLVALSSLNKWSTNCITLQAMLQWPGVSLTFRSNDAR